MRSKVRASIALLALLGACGLAACVIGPKQDDPAAPTAAEDAGSTDTGATATPDGGGFDMDAIAEDTGPFSSADSETPSGACGGDGGDAACDGGDASSDGGDAAADGGDAHTSDAGDAPAADALGGD